MRQGVVLHQLDIISKVILNSAKQWTAYRSNIIMVVLVAPLQMTAQYFIWKAVLSTKGSINGLSFQNMLTYYAITAILSMFVSDDMHGTVRYLIGSGDLSTMLLKPVNYYFYAFFEKIGSKIISIFMEVIPMSVIFILIFHINLAPKNIIWAVFSIALSFVLVYLVNFCIGMTAFWFVNNWGIHMAAEVISNICSGILIPLMFFPPVIQKILFILPFQFMYYIPTQVILGSYKLAGFSMQPGEIVLVQLFYVALIWLLSNVMWRAGLKKYTGVGI